MSLYRGIGLTVLYCCEKGVSCFENRTWKTAIKELRALMKMFAPRKNVRVKTCGALMRSNCDSYGAARSELWKPFAWKSGNAIRNVVMELTDCGAHRNLCTVCLAEGSRLSTVSTEASRKFGALNYIFAFAPPWPLANGHGYQ
jgi:hypothetical protein